jgi:hypothetical protein
VDRSKYTSRFPEIFTNAALAQGVNGNPFERVSWILAIAVTEAQTGLIKLLLCSSQWHRNAKGHDTNHD